MFECNPNTIAVDTEDDRLRVESVLASNEKTV